MSQSWIERGMDAVQGFDWEGVVDRWKAYDELSGRFDVVEAARQGDPRQKLPNSVTPEEYADIVRTYSDIRLGRGDLTLDTSEMTPGSDQETDYRDGVMADIAALLQTEAGRKELATLHDNPLDHHATIRARHEDSDGDKDPTNDGNSPLDLDNAGVLAYAGGQTTRNADGTPGSGTDVDILYNPGIDPWDYQGDVLNPYWVAENPWALQTRSDVTLAHEMAHACYSTTGTKDPGDVVAADGVAIDAAAGVPRAEHQGAGLGKYQGAAIGENAYRRERRALAAGGGPGVLDGDATMVERETYHGVTPAPRHAIPWD